jgi:mannose-6-phosphate isomerase-like protein (cupin superfamily)
MRLSGKIDKGWGSEEIFATNNLYCGKLLNFKSDARFSMHFHAEKHESWYVLSGNFIVEWIDTATAKTHTSTLKPGDTWVNVPLMPHRLICLEEGTIIEVSTPDSVEDNYRVLPGDSQQ